MKAAKGRRSAVKRGKAKPTATAAARKRLWLFAQFIQTQDPYALAAEVTLVADTLHHCERIQLFFQRYANALRTRRRQ